jgi:hypothetical protein
VSGENGQLELPQINIPLQLSLTVSGIYGKVSTALDFAS